MAYSTTHEEKLSQEELERMRDENEKTLSDYYRYRLPYWEFHNPKNISE